MTVTLVLVDASSGDARMHCMIDLPTMLLDISYFRYHGCTTIRADYLGSE